MSVITASEWDDEMADGSADLLLDRDEPAELPEYWSHAELEAERHRQECEAAELELMHLTTPGMRFLSCIHENMTEAEVAELQEIEARHLREHGARIEQLKRLREYHHAEWEHLTNGRPEA